MFDNKRWSNALYANLDYAEMNKTWTNDEIIFTSNWFTLPVDWWNWNNSTTAWNQYIYLAIAR